MVDPADPRRAFTHLARHFGRGDHDRRRSVRDRRDVGITQRRMGDRPAEQRLGVHVFTHHRVWVRQSVPT